MFQFLGSQHSFTQNIQKTHMFRGLAYNLIVQRMKNLSQEALQGSSSQVPSLETLAHLPDPPSHQDPVVP